MKWFELCIQLIQAIAWPAVVIVLVFAFHGPIANLFSNATKVAAKLPGGIELNIEQVAASAAAAGVAVGQASAKENKPVTQEAVENIATAIARSPSVGQRSLQTNRILWVDDNPGNNISLIRAFEKLGIQVAQARSTEEAKQMLQRENFDVIISDMSRPPDQEAGLTLLKYLKDRNSKIPVIIFAARWAAEHRNEAATLGVLTITNDPSEVYRSTLNALHRG